VTSGTGNVFRAVIQDASKRATTTGGGDRGGAVELDLPALDGKWTVVRASGLLPRCGVEKEVVRGRGVTTFYGRRVASFDVAHFSLVYRFVPVRDELVPVNEDFWLGVGKVCGLTFCRFFLVRDAANKPAHTRANVKPPIHTVPSSSGWRNEQEGSSQALSEHRYKADAVAAGRKRARLDETEHVIHKKDGTIGQRNRYGSDPRRHKG
jgi:Uncharacterized protein conserved in bacteria (DUF2188)